MSCAINIHYRIIITISIQIKSRKVIRNYKVNAILRNKSSCIRVVVSRFEVIKTVFVLIVIIVISTVSYRVYITDMSRHTLSNFITVYIINPMITPSVVDIVCFECSVCIVDMGYITHKVSAIDVSISCKLKSYCSTCSVDKVYCSATTGLANQFAISIGKRNTVLLSTDTVCIVFKVIRTVGL